MAASNAHGITEDGKLQTLSVDGPTYELVNGGDGVKTLTWTRSFKEILDKLKDHLKYVGLFPDGGMALSQDITNPNKHIPSDWRSFNCQARFSEDGGTRLDISLRTDNGVIPFAYSNTQDRSVDAFVRMSRIAAQCNMMLNGRGAVMDMPHDIADIVKGRMEVVSEIQNHLNSQPQSDIMMNMKDSWYQCLYVDNGRFIFANMGEGNDIAYDYESLVKAYENGKVDLYLYPHEEETHTQQADFEDESNVPEFV